MFSGHGGLAGEDQLRDVSKSDGVTAGDAFAGKLSDEIAKEEIDLVRGGEAVNVVEKLGGQDFGVYRRNGGLEATGVVSAQSRAPGTVCGTMSFVDQHVAALPVGVLVLALVIGLGA